VAALNLLRLAAMLHREDFRERGVRTIEAFRAQWLGAPYALPQMLCALELALQPPPQVVLAGDPRAEDFRALAVVLHERPGPRRVLLGAPFDGFDRLTAGALRAGDGGAGQAWLAARVPELAAMRPADGRATAYVCENFTCRQPVHDAAALRALLG
jgi:uncharacterized protein YyaL (SSP411 family)